MIVNFYTVLGISQTASQDEIRKSYLKMAKKFHPDKNIEGTEKFKEIGNAYKALSCAETRKKHDAELLAALCSAGPSNGSCYSSSYRSNFTSTYTSHSTKRQKTTADGQYRSDYNIKTTTRITLNQSFTGLSQHYVKYVETLYCNTCKGKPKGAQRTHTCAYCVGEGFVVTVVGRDKIKVACRTCDGMGTVTTFSKCRDCRGKKRKECGFHVPIAKGVHNYHTLKVKHRGNLMPDGVRRGDVIIEVHVDVESTDGSFKRRGDDLHLNLAVDLRDAILGFGNRPTFKHLDGRPIYLSQIPGTVLKPGSQITVPGDGMPVFMSDDNSCGDIHVTFDIVFPDFHTNIYNQYTTEPANSQDPINGRNGHYELIDSEDEF
ncbi:hypothetical protein INT48_007344 [Thamnidium elegans]|uniref:J domain-containing protein n=1 Tax=Thamnidium elegans TaxID=101142 RepID=A0A8H7VU08_9FUNG|nr:hypothetical protein INT48_007344 [Thamnidium elegans]